MLSIPGWNLLDFTVVLLSTVDLLAASSGQHQIIRVLRILRVTRLTRFVKRNR